MIILTYVIYEKVIYSIGGNFFCFIIIREIILKEEARASRIGLENMKASKATKEQIDAARNKYDLALKSYRERMKAYRNEPILEFLKRFGGKKIRKKPN